MRPSKVDSAHLDEVCALLMGGGMPMMSALALHDKLEAGELRAILARSTDGVATTVMNERGAWRHLVAGAGPESALLVALTELRACSDALIWDEGALKIESATLDGLGYRLLERQIFTQDLSLVPLSTDPADLEVFPLEDSVRPEARALFSRTHAMSVEGLYATLPEAPTPEQCEIAFEAYLSGKQGAAVASACVVIRAEARIVGVICCAATQNEGTAVLLGLAVDPSVRGRGLSRVLVRRAQRELKASGFARMLFLTTDRNAPVHRLFTAEEIISIETFPARVWFRDTPERMRPNQ